MPSTSKGRPKVSYEEASEKTKQRRVEELLSTTNSDMIERIASQHDKKCMSIAKAVALIYDLGLSIRKYNILRKTVNNLIEDFFPSYFAIKKYTDELLPKPIVVSEISAEVPLQSLLNRTVESLIKNFKINCSMDVVLECKWGFDGSSGHSLYKQTFSGDDRTDEFMFVIAMVPLKISDAQAKTEVWKNNSPSSTTNCRPIKIIYAKENPTLIREHEKNITDQIQKLSSYMLEYEGFKIKFQYEMYLTMIDGAVVNVLAQNSASSNCYLCGATPSLMNSFNVVERPINENFLRYGLSTLHAQIKFFECLLHISYKLPFKKWKVFGEENKKLFNENKQKIQNEFRQQMGLIVDRVKTGYGTSNDGNTARRFFRNPEKAAHITNINIDLIKNFSLILRILSCGYEINVDTFKNLLKETYNLYMTNYSWYYLPPTVHKVLIHGCDIIKSLSLPIGLLSEDALECRHKEIRKFRKENSRKNSRCNNIRDVFIRMLLSSEPLINFDRNNLKKNERNIQDLQSFLVVQQQKPANEEECDFTIFSSSEDDND